VRRATFMVADIRKPSQKRPFKAQVLTAFSSAAAKSFEV
jgi:hypothetical protein